MEQHVDQVRRVFKKSGFNDKDIYRLASVLSRLEAEVGSSKCWNVGDVQVIDKAFASIKLLYHSLSDAVLPSLFYAQSSWNDKA